MLVLDFSGNLSIIQHDIAMEDVSLLKDFVCEKVKKLWFSLGRDWIAAVPFKSMWLVRFLNFFNFFEKSLMLTKAEFI